MLLTAAPLILYIMDKLIFVKRIFGLIADWAGIRNGRTAQGTGSAAVRSSLHLPQDAYENMDVSRGERQLRFRAVPGEGGSHDHI